MSDLDNLSKAIVQAPEEPLLPIEKKLIGWSLGIGIVLLVVLGIINHYLPVATV
ncbi:hypothetical protein PIN31115_03711 [Pandoraea iniqua]|uniref:Uncharacterized protein n=1 Tax=Pandoraea iniqua TaxID=2508288 RepID=A0A5E4X8H7_9BURK|nr:hypothetical protein [Pandoraea iniqua]VVE32566.1 hypothetical protein PIN31115_03711 [Pandoraea iniqua]